MKTGNVPLLLVFVSAMFIGPLQGQDRDQQHEQTLERLDYIHFDSVTHSVGWGVSEGTIGDDGTFKDNGDPIATYSLNLETGVLTHDGDDGPLSPDEAYDASRILSGLSDLMRGYEQSCPELADPSPQDPEEDGSAEETSPELARIAATCRMVRPSSSGRENPGYIGFAPGNDIVTAHGFFQQQKHSTDWRIFPAQKGTCADNRNTPPPQAASSGAFQQRPLSPFFTSELVEGRQVKASKACFGLPSASSIRKSAGQSLPLGRNAVESFVAPCLSIAP